MRRPLMALCALFLTLPAAAQAQGQAQGQEWQPERPVRIILPFPPGGATDLIARILAERASRDLPHRWVVENRSGANGNIGMAAAAQSAPDGYTLGACTIGNCAINAAIYARMPFDIERDLVPVFWSASVMNALAVRPDHPARDFQQFVAWAKREGPRVNFSSSGFGASNHLLGEFLNGRLGLQMTHVPFRGGAPGMQAVISGDTQLFFENTPTLIGAIRGGQLRALVVSGRTRDAALPDVPTLEEAGMPDAVIEPWFGYMAPRGTPPAVVARLNALLNMALTDELVQSRLRDMGARPEGGPPERFVAHVNSEVTRWREVVRVNRIERITE
ncbi:tripartite tricarboxylate transporter substrate binding protein [Sediminicoccus sp. KRV36]|uniref:Bug family tripartite tricarboxylate transporter substrate binding protein n=1 Tax=Sediminicoccus sp. KRV36 TaxID=3133721 RepID=UPI00200E5369|nr:tripartite tricarboxylate transporter substrate binding protein [Sediminicoccus rosea]UPY35641.1 tripartite tricarboxylate transporter substrate binding protein [Sediminicoccus rosea]